MVDLPDFDLRRTPTEPPDADLPRDRPVGLWIAIGAVGLAIGAASYYAFLWKPRPAPAVSGTATSPTRVSEPLPALGGKADSIAIPPLDASDSVVRTLVQALSESPAVMAWLPTNGLIRNFTVVVANIGYGYVDDRLEDLTPAQKQLLRMGPRNVRIIKARLRAIALALGIPPSHLPR